MASGASWGSPAESTATRRSIAPPGTPSATATLKGTFGPAIEYQSRQRPSSSGSAGQVKFWTHRSAGPPSLPRTTGPFFQASGEQGRGSSLCPATAIGAASEAPQKPMAAAPRNVRRSRNASDLAHAWLISTPLSPSCPILRNPTDRPPSPPPNPTSAQGRPSQRYLRRNGSGDGEPLHPGLGDAALGAAPSRRWPPASPHAEDADPIRPGRPACVPPYPPSSSRTSGTSPA